MVSHWLRAHTHINKKYMNEKQKNLEVNSLEKKPVRIHISCGKQWINEFINDRIIWNDNLLHLNFSAAPFHHSFQRVFFLSCEPKQWRAIHLLAFVSVHGLFDNGYEFGAEWNWKIFWEKSEDFLCIYLLKK